MHRKWRIKSLIGDTSEWFQDIGLTEDEAIAKARIILEAIEMESSIMESALQWDEFVWTICHSPNVLQELNNSWKDLHTEVGARRLVMYMTS